MRAANENRAIFALPVRSLCFAAALLVGSSCTENLPSGPDTFGATIKILVPRDTVVVGDSSAVQAQALDSQGHAIQGLKFNWTSGTPTVLDFSAPASGNADAEEGRVRTFVGKFPGRSVVTLALPDTRFVTSNATRTETVVVGGVRILSTHDSTLTAVNDTVRAVAAGLVRVNGALATRVSQGVKWTHLGSHVSVVGTGDTIRYIAQSNGADTIIATHDFCLAGAKCADTAVVRVNQQLTLTLSTRTLNAWSFSDTLGPTIRLSDRRGNGMPGATIRFVPATAFDSAIVKVTPPFGVSNPANGTMAAPRLVSAANGVARVGVLGIAADGFTIVALDSVIETVRQVARRVAVEPLRANITSGDSIPIKAVARDARGAIIADATVNVSATGIPLNNNGIWAGPMTVATPTLGTITATVSGQTLPAANPGAPQIPVTSDDAQITVLPPISVIAGATQVSVSALLLDSLGQPAFNRWLRFGSPFTPPPDSVQADGSGAINTVWTPRDSAGTYTLTGVRGALTALNSLADSAGRIVVRKSVTVLADVPSPLKSTMSMSSVSIPVNGTAVVTIKVNDRFGNPVKTATPAAFAITSAGAGGTFSGHACSFGVCTVTYTAPAAAGGATVMVRIGGVDVLFSPMAVTVF
jgi:hypothetical protein